MWKGRFQENPSQRLQDFSESISLDWKLFEEDIAGSIAHARALLNAGIITQQDFQQIESGLLQIAAEIRNGTFPFDPSLEDIHMNIEAALTRRIGEAGARLHTARSRNDQVALDLKMWIRKSLTTTCSSIQNLQRALLSFASRFPNAILPGYTHLQRAQPIPLAHHLLAYVEMLDRDHSRLKDCSRRLDTMPLGSGALAGSTITLDRAAIARELGFSELTQNSLDAVASRDFALEALSALAILGVHLSRLSEDIILWCSTEFGFLQLSDRHTTGSSLMPQKKNPDVAELVRGKTGRLTGNLVSLLITMKGLPLAYNRDMQEDKKPVFDSFETAISSLDIFAEMLNAASWDESKSARAASDPLLLVTDLADHLVRQGIPFRKAHETVGRLVLLAQEKNIPIDQLPDDIFLAAHPSLTPETRAHIFNLQAALNARTTPGSPSFTNISKRLQFWLSKLSQ